ncbi:unnamed protein product [Mytilus edulis]|uniref:Phospholipase A2 n=1 Tax=Mytilus edulis TaxID=6550 RepID=A0A8S3QW51_MYTED|nr:unnamed protein product [Mytilus edulis]
MDPHQLKTMKVESKRVLYYGSLAKVSTVVCVAAIGNPNTLLWTSNGENAMDTNQDLLLPDDLKSIYRIHFILKTKSDNVYFADDLNNYGCWCAQNGTSYPVDELDRCCLEHQMCLKEILSKGCPLSSRYYSYEQCFGLIFKCSKYKYLHLVI